MGKGIRGIDLQFIKSIPKMNIKKLTGILVLIAVITWSCNQSSGEGESKVIGKGVEKEQPQTSGDKTPVPQQNVQTTSPQTTPAAGELDQYGRKPGDQHYGHSHAPKDQAATNEGSPVQTNPAQSSPLQSTPTGEPDQYGRMPGDEHYGHTHP